MLGLLWFLMIGLAAGWLASQIMEKGRGDLVSHLVVGVVGALLGGLMFGLLGLQATGPVGSLLTATVGAVTFIALLREIRRRR